MKLCAMTMAHQDYWALGLWYAYYGDKLGHENLVIIEHGYDPKYRDLFPKATFVTYPRDLLTQRFDTDRYDFMDKVQDDLRQRYDFIIRGDADELVVFDTEQYGSLQEVVTRCDGFMMSTGVQIVDVGEATTAAPHGKDLSRLAVFDSRYSKAWLTNGDWYPREHGVAAEKGMLFSLEKHLLGGIYLLHLKYADAEALFRQGEVRTAVTTRDDTHGLVTMWGNDDTYLNKILKYSTAPMCDFDVLTHSAMTHALTETRRDPKSGVFRIKRGFWKGPALLPERVCRALAPKDAAS